MPNALQTPAYLLGLRSTGLAVARDLGRRKIPVWAATWEPRDAALVSRYLRPRICPDPLLYPDQLLVFLLEESRRLGQAPVLFPTSDLALWFIARYGQALAPHFLLQPVSSELLLSLLNKWTQYQLASAHDLPVLPTLLARSAADIMPIVRSVAYPVIVKPCYGFLWRRKYREKVARVSSPEELEARLRQSLSWGLEIIVQPVLPGPATSLVSVCVCLGADGAVLGLVAQRKLRQYPVDEGVGTLVEIADLPDVTESLLRFLRAVGYRGSAEIEFKYDRQTRCWKLIEINPRLWEQNALAAACGLHFPYLEYLDRTGQSPSPAQPIRRHVRWLALWEDIHAAVELTRRRELTFGQWLDSLRKVRAHSWFASDDPLPCVSYYAHELKMVLAAVLRVIKRSRVAAP